MGVKLSELPQINAALAAAMAWAKSAASASAPPSLRATHAKRPALSLVWNIQIAINPCSTLAELLRLRLPACHTEGVLMCRFSKHAYVHGAQACHSSSSHAW